MFLIGIKSVRNGESVCCKKFYVRFMYGETPSYSFYFHKYINCLYVFYISIENISNYSDEWETVFK